MLDLLETKAVQFSSLIHRLKKIPASRTPHASSVTLQKVWFRHSPQAPYLFKRASLSIGAGQKIWVWGTAACGKSTLVKLIAGAAIPQSGRILVDGAEITPALNPVAMTKVRVVEKQRLRAGSIEENIRTYGTEPLSTRVETAAKLAGIHHQVLATSDGYQTSAHTRDIQMSGALCEGILLARAIHSRPGILLIDNPDNDFDPQYRSSLIQRLARLKMTVIVLSRYPPIGDFAFRALLLDSGAICETPILLKNNSQMRLPI